MSAVFNGDLNQLLADSHVVAVVTAQPLRPVDGPGAPFFPPTYLGKDNTPTYCISDLGEGRNLCVVDSVQSQANRMEMAFMSEPYRALVRPVAVSAELASGEVSTIDLLQMSHRIADAALTFSTLADQAKRAIDGYASSPDDIARLSPMSLLCGMWNSRGSKSRGDEDAPDTASTNNQIKIPRAFSATITARNVAPLRRMATFNAAFGGAKALGLEEGRKYSEIGLDNAVAEALGGVVAAGEIVRTATLNMIALRQNCKISYAAPSLAARYIYSLGLIALGMQPESFLRQGCLLVAAGPIDAHLVMRDGSEQSFALSHDDALVFARRASAAFGVPALEPLTGTFQKERLPTKATASKGKSKADKAK